MGNSATFAVGLVVLLLVVFAIRRLRTKGLCDCKECSGCCSEGGCSGCGAAAAMTAAAEEAAGMEKL